MVTGLILIVATGLLWCANAIVMSYIARKSMNFISVIGIQAIVGAGVAWVFLSDSTILFYEKPSRLAELAFIMVGSGIICTLGMFTMQKAMKIGHHGIVKLRPNGDSTPPVRCIHPRRVFFFSHE